MSTGFTAIEQFKKFSPEEKKKTAVKFFGFYDGSNRAYINDADNFEAEEGALTDDGLEDWTEFLQGEDPFYFSDPPQSIQQEVMRKFDNFLYKEFRELQSLKHGYEKPIALLSADEVIKVIRGLRGYQDAVRGISEEVLPAVEEITKEELEDDPLKFGILTRALTSVDANIDNAIHEITLYFSAAKEAEKRRDEGTKRRVIAHFEQYQREIIQISKRTMVVNKQLKHFRERLPKKIKEMFKDGTFDEENMNAFVRVHNYLREEVPDYMPFVGSIRMYDSSQPMDSQQNLVALGSLGVDSALLGIAIKAAMGLPGGRALNIAFAAGAFIAAETALGAVLSPLILKGSEGIAYWLWPELHKADKIDRQGFEK